MKKIAKSELALVIAICSLAWMAMSLLVPILPLYLTSIGITTSWVGAMLAVAMIGMVGGEIWGGWIADRITLKIPLSVGTFLCAPLVICFIFTRSIPHILLIFLFWGVVRATIFGPGRGYVGRVASLSNKTTLMAIFLAVESFAGGLGSLACGFIADHWGYSWDFYISAGISILAGILVIVGLPKIRFFISGNIADPISKVEQPTQNNTNDYHRSFNLQCIVSMLFWWGSGALSFLPLLATEVVGVGATEVGILFTIIGVIEAILFLPMGRLADRKGKKVLMLIGLLLLGSAFGGLAFINSYSLLILFSILVSLSMAMFSPAALALISDTAPAFWQNTAMGFYGATENIGFMIGSGLGGIAWNAWGPLSFLTVSVPSFLGAVICGRFIRERISNKG
jgi:MFS family permease